MAVDGKAWSRNVGLSMPRGGRRSWDGEISNFKGAVSVRSSLRVAACNSPGKQWAKWARSRDGEISNFETGALCTGQSGSLLAFQTCTDLVYLQRMHEKATRTTRKHADARVTARNRSSAMGYTPRSSC